MQRTAEDYYIGKVNNTEEGRLALIGAGKQYLQTLAAESVIEATGFDVTLDPRFTAARRSLSLRTIRFSWRGKRTTPM
ncbi:hypothetical protein HMSSN036_06850 [Paenibacillus macerans]|nr:hypothetical protein HMSSN036_06850 [Paenibacillus macerans]